jgi:hypothetical protein
MNKLRQIPVRIESELYDKISGIAKKTGHDSFSSFARKAVSEAAGLYDDKLAAAQAAEDRANLVLRAVRGDELDNQEIYRLKKIDEKLYKKILQEKIS